MFEEFAHHVFVEDARKDVAGLGALRTRLKPVQEAGERDAVAPGLAAGFGLGSARGQAVMALRTRPPLAICQSRKMPPRGKEQVGRPDRKEGGKLVLPAQGDAGGGEQVIEEDQQNGEDKAGALAAAPRGHAQRNAHQHQHQAGGGIGKAVVQFDQEALARRARGCAPAARPWAWRRWPCPCGPGAHRSAGSAPEGRSVVAKVEMLYCSRLAGDGLVLRAVAQPHQQLLRASR